MADEAPVSQAPATLASGRWADGYLFAPDPTAASYTPSPDKSFNASGGAITVTKVAGTTGRYVARFNGLSALLGNKSRVHVSGAGDDATYCKPVGNRLVRDQLEVRCFQVGTGAAANARFSLQVSGKRDDRAFAYAHKPTAAYYSPAAAGSWNPAGTSRVYRDGVGRYRVVFAGLGARLSPGGGGHVQVNAVGTGRQHCEIGAWGGSPDLAVRVHCFTPAGAPADAEFTVLFALPAAHLAYALADRPTAASYIPSAVYSLGLPAITRFRVGQYYITWTNVDAEIIDLGNAQVTAYGEGAAQCKVALLTNEGVGVQCFAANGAPVDTYFTVLLGS